jgi:formylglycine-generating enzyme required for sulfatase activity
LAAWIPGPLFLEIIMPLRFTLAAFGLVVALTAGAAGLHRAVEDRSASAAAERPATVLIPAGHIDYPLSGEFLEDGRPVAAPRRRVWIMRAFEIMSYQVSVGEYQRCVADGACQPAEMAPTVTADMPVTGVSFLDAEAYAAWLSEATGEDWRLPTDIEWVHAAGERFAGTTVELVDDPDNPARRWLDRYRQESAARRPADPHPKQRGHFGVNEGGLFDIAGNVWEWTATCYSRTTMAAGQPVGKAVENCGARVVEGVHRAYMSVFIRDPRSGGCAVGKPPDNLGFRLVRLSAGSSVIIQ